MIRTFIAVEIESREVLRRLIEVRDQLMATGAELKPVEDNNIHLTLRFIGEVPVGIVRTLCDSILHLKYQGFQIHVKGLGVFPSTSRPRVIWAGVSEGSDKLVELYELVESIVRKLGIPAEKEEFVPHITLARVKGPRNIDKLLKIMSALIDVDFGYTHVGEVFVKKSVLTPSGPVYSNLCSVKLY